MTRPHPGKSRKLQKKSRKSPLWLFAIIVIIPIIAIAILASFLPSDLDQDKVFFGRKSLESLSSAETQPSTSPVHHCRKIGHLKNRLNCHPFSIAHVAITVDGTYFRGTVAAIYSSLQNSNCPENIFFHLIYSEWDNLTLIIADIFPSLKFKKHYFNPETVKGLISPTPHNIRLEEPLNYARNYLAHLLDPRVHKVIYLDSDIIVLDDILHLWSIPLGSSTVGSPENCDLNFTDFFSSNFWVKYSGAFKGRKNKLCYFNSGVMLIDLDKWRRFKCTVKIEKWMKIQREERIYDLGSMPPFLLLFAGDTTTIYDGWNLNEIGSHSPEVYYKEEGRGVVSMIHWTGEEKPWLRLDFEEPELIDYIWAPYDLCRPAERHGLQEATPN